MRVTVTIVPEREEVRDPVEELPGVHDWQFIKSRSLTAASNGRLSSSFVFSTFTTVINLFSGRFIYVIYIRNFHFRKFHFRTEKELRCSRVPTQLLMTAARCRRSNSELDGLCFGAVPGDHRVRGTSMDKPDLKVRAPHFWNSPESIRKIS